MQYLSIFDVVTMQIVLLGTYWINKYVKWVCLFAVSHVHIRLFTIKSFLFQNFLDFSFKIIFSQTLIICFFIKCKPLHLIKKRTGVWSLSVFMFMNSHTMVSDYINTMKTIFFIVNKLFSNYKFTSSQRKAFKIDSFSWLLCLYVSSCLTALYKSKFKSKVVFIVLILSPTTVVCLLDIQKFSSFKVFIFNEDLIISSSSKTISLISPIMTLCTSLKILKIFSNIREEIWIENTAFKDKLEEQADKINGINHR